MKLLLLEHPRGRSTIHFNTVAHAPLSSSLLSGYIASLLQSRGVEVELHDDVVGLSDFASVIATVENRSFDILGVHLVYSWEHTAAVMLLLKEIASRKGVPVIAYGFFPTFAGEDLMRAHSWITAVVRGEPELTFLELCSRGLEENAVSHVAGLIWRRGKDWVVNPPRQVIRDLDSLPFPRRTRAGLARSGGTILGSRGCYASCSFCSINNFYGVNPLWRGRSPENIYAEVRAILPSLHRAYIYFVDANFFGPGEAGQRRAEAIAACLEGEAGLRFGLECRANDVREPALRRLARAGLRDVFLGMESGSQKGLDRMHKQLLVEHNAAALTLLRHYGIEPHIGFIMFEPDADFDEVRENFRFLKSQRLLDRFTSTVDLLYHPGIALRGTGMYARLFEEGRLMHDAAVPYHGNYRFRDAKVSICADIFSVICRYLLERMEDPASPIYWQRLYALDCGHPDSTTADELNRWLISQFEALLHRLALSTSSAFNSREQERWVEEALGYIDRLLSEAHCETERMVE